MRLLLALCVVLTACGQSGALYLPEQSPAPVATPAPESEKEKKDEATPTAQPVTP